MILSSWLTTVTNRIWNASARRRLRRKFKRNRYAQPAGVMGSSTSYARPSGDIRESLWHTFDVAPRFHRDSRRFQSQLWSTFDVAPLAETLEDRTLLSSVSVNSLTSNDTTPTVTGSYVDDAGGGGSPSIQITVNGNMYAATLNPGGVGSSIGTWSANVTNVLPENVYDVAAQVTDSNSATSNDATSNELTIDTTAPTATVSVDDSSLIIGDTAT
ncbi:MAG: hypothetical protein O3B86_14825, partial [Planctomycetota bacterium]|nr:hypothetical protein [Planctomycetota bacterium]